MKLLAIFHLLTQTLAFGNTSMTTPHYHIKMTIDPIKQQIASTTKVSHLSQIKDLSFLIHKDFVIQSLTEKNLKELSFQNEEKPNVPRYFPLAKKIKIDSAKKVDELQFVYSGQIKETIADVNKIQKDLVELALYATWLPINLEIKTFTFSLELTLPSDFIVTSNGNTIKNKKINHQTTWYIENFKNSPVNDLAIIASPNFELSQIKDNNKSIEIYHTKAALKLIEGKKELFFDVLKYFEHRFGKNSDVNVLRVVYSPRIGWMYSRLPTFIVSEIEALNLIKRPFGKEYEDKGNVHEMSHFWWKIADMYTPDDWLNEGLAQYSTLTYIVHNKDKYFLNKILENSFDAIKKSKLKESVSNTSEDSEERFLNQYTKPSILFYAFEKKFGQDKIDILLKSFYEKYSQSRNATTEDLLAMAKKQLNSDGFSFLEKYINALGWTPEMINTLETIIKQ